MRLKQLSMVLTLVGALFLHPVPADAFTFTKNLLITDNELENDDGLSLRGIKAFLREKESILADFQAADIDGRERTVAEIIYNAAKKYSLNPMLFLVMAQKESSAIYSKVMTYAIKNWILGYGRCDGCTESTAAPYRGIANQMYSAADRFRNSYLVDLQNKGYTISGWGPGITKTTIDNITVTPQNNATAALYTYNPCVGAYGGGFTQYGCNSVFQKLWQEWNPRIRYPNGSLLQIGKVVYLIQNNQKRAFTSKAALQANYNIKNVIPVPVTVGEQYADGTDIYFPNYSLLRNPAGTVYLLVNGEKRGIKSAEVFRKLGFNPEEVLDVEWREISQIPDGKSITLKMQYPRGVLLQNKITGGVVYIDVDSVRHDIIAPEILLNRFPHDEIVPANPEEIEEFRQGDDIKLKDGTLVTSANDKSVYVIADGQRRPFASKKAFDSYGYRWENIIKVTTMVLKLQPLGKIIYAP